VVAMVVHQVVSEDRLEAALEAADLAVASEAVALEVEAHLEVGKLV